MSKQNSMIHRTKGSAIAIAAVVLAVTVAPGDLSAMSAQTAINPVNYSSVQAAATTTDTGKPEGQLGWFCPPICW